MPIDIGGSEKKKSSGQLWESWNKDALEKARSEQMKQMSQPVKPPSQLPPFRLFYPEQERRNKKTMEMLMGIWDNLLKAWDMFAK